MKRTYLLTRVDIALTLGVAAFIGLLAGTGGTAETGKSMHLRLAYSAITVNQAIPWISYEAGHFKKHGLDVELVHASSILALQALLAGEVAIAQSVTDACVSANLNGADTVFLGAILDKPLYGFMSIPRSRRPRISKASEWVSPDSAPHRTLSRGRCSKCGAWIPRRMSPWFNSTR